MCTEAARNVLDCRYSTDIYYGRVNSSGFDNEALDLINVCYLILHFETRQSSDSSRILYSK